MVKSGTLIALILANCCFCLSSLAENGICGWVRDTKGHGVFAANVYLTPHSHIATASGEDGFFCLEIPPACQQDTLVCSFVGYKTQKILLSDVQQKDSIEIRLKDDWLSLNEVVVAMNPEITEEFSLEKLEKLDIYLSPLAAGDPLNALSILPAATNTSESANPEFRGSPANASQVSLNGINIVNPVRNTQMSGMGNFSLFNTELVQKMDVYASNPPLTHGNSLAGLVEIKTAQRVEKSQTQIAASLANVGLLRTQKIKDSCFVQVYGNMQFSKPYLYLNDTQEMLQSFSSQDVGLNVHAHAGASDLNYYAYFINEGFEGKEHYFNRNVESMAEKQRLFGVFNWHYRWKQFRLETNMGHHWSKGGLRLAHQQESLKEVQYQGNIKLKYFASDYLYVQAGISEDFMRMECASSEPKYPWDQRENATRIRQDSSLHYHLPETFVYLRYRKNNWIAGLGLRKHLGREESPWAYQANIRYLSDRFGSLQFSAGKYYAYVYPLVEEPRMDLQTSAQAALEYIYGSDGCQVRAALFHKQEYGDIYLNHLQDYREGKRSIGGAELSLEKQWEALKLSCSYTYLNADISWQHEAYKASNDLPYLLKAQVSHTNDRFFTIACCATLRPGLWYTPIEGGEWHQESASFRPVYGEYNSKRLEPYQRFDLSLNKVHVLDKGRMLVVFASMSNIFNRHNQAGMVYSLDYADELTSIPMQLYSIYGGLQLSF